MGFPRGSAVKNLPAMQEVQGTWIQSPGWEVPLEEGMATHSSILTWRIPWTEEPGSPQSIGSLSQIQLKQLSTHTHVVKWSESCAVVSDSLPPHGLYSPWNSPGQNTGVGSLSILQGIFPTLGLNPGLLHRKRILSQLSHKGNPRILKWVDYPFFSGSSWPRNRIRVSCIAGGFFTNWAIREALITYNINNMYMLFVLTITTDNK